MIDGTTVRYNKVSSADVEIEVMQRIPDCSLQAKFQGGHRPTLIFTFSFWSDRDRTNPLTENTHNASKTHKYLNWICRYNHVRVLHILDRPTVPTMFGKGIYFGRC